MYQKVECINCGRFNLSNVRKCNCGTMQHSKSNNPEFFSEKARCYVMGCTGKADERRGENVWMCGIHSEELFLKASFACKEKTEAQIIKIHFEKSKNEKENLSHREYFEKTSPKLFIALQQTMDQVHRNRDNIFAVEDYLNGG